MTLPPEQKVVAPEAVMAGCAGKAFTVTDTCPLTSVNPSFTVTLYVVLAAGVAVGFARVEENPAGTELQLYVYVPDPPLAPASSCTLAPTQIVPGIADGVVRIGFHPKW